MKAMDLSKLVKEKRFLVASLLYGEQRCRVEVFLMLVIN
jgi:hypothetical protein